MLAKMFIEIFTSIQRLFIANNLHIKRLADFHPPCLLQRRDSLRHKNELLTTFRTINNWRRKLGLRADIVNNASNGLSATIAYKFYLRSDFKFTELRFGYKEAYFYILRR